MSNNFELVSARGVDDLESDYIPVASGNSMPDNIFPIRSAAELDEPEVDELQVDQNGLPLHKTDSSYAEPREDYSIGKRRAKKSKLLSAQEEVILAKRIEAGDELARHLMIEANQGLVVTCAEKYLGQGLDMADLVSEANLGLMRAIDKFEWQRGFKFSTLAMTIICQDIRRSIAEKGHIIKMGRHFHGRVGKVKQARDTLEKQLEREPTPEEIAEKIGFTVDDVNWLIIRDSDTNTISLEKPASPNSDTEFGELVPNNEKGTFELVADKLDDESLYAALDLLEPDQKLALVLQYGLEGNEPMKIHEISQYMEITINQARHLVNQAKKSLRKILEKSSTKEQLLTRAQELAQ